MSDLFDVRKKVEEGASWRGSITVTLDGEQQELTVRQLRDPEFWDVMADIDTDELESLQSDLPEEEMEEFRELQQTDNLDDEQEGRLDELQQKIEDEDIDLFEALSRDTYEGIKQAAKYGIEPDDDDVHEALVNHTNQIEEQYGETSDEAARQFINEQVIDPMIERSTDFASFAIGVKVFGATLDDTGNSEN
jgi:hypothetical protein